MSAVAEIGLTPKEQANARAALRFLRAKCGTWSTLAKALHLGESTVGNVAGGHAAVTPTVVFRIAKFARVGIDDVLTGRFPAPGTCPHCGHRTEPS
jgi:hypothetical protein